MWEIWDTLQGIAEDAILTIKINNDWVSMMNFSNFLNGAYAEAELLYNKALTKGEWPDKAKPMK